VVATAAEKRLNIRRNPGAKTDEGELRFALFLF
jgi:hypothetical protein